MFRWILFAGLVSLSIARSSSNITVDEETSEELFMGVVQAKCPTGQKQFNGYCYEYVSEEKNFADAEAGCQSKNGMQLASVLFDGEQRFVKNTFNIKFGGAWIGLKNFGTIQNANWRWLDNSPFSFTHWFPDTKLTDACVKYQQTGRWLTTPCDTQLPYICKMRAP